MRRSVWRSVVVDLAPRQRRRIRSEGPELPMESIVIATGRVRWAHDLGNEYRAIVELARRPMSLVEIGAALAVPMAVVRGLVADLVGGGYVDMHVPPPAFAAGGPSAVVLARLLRGLRPL